MTLVFMTVLVVGLQLCVYGMSVLLEEDQMKSFHTCLHPDGHSVNPKKIAVYPENDTVPSTIVQGLLQHLS